METDSPSRRADVKKINRARKQTDSPAPSLFGLWSKRSLPEWTRRAGGKNSRVFLMSIENAFDGCKSHFTYCEHPHVLPESLTWSCIHGFNLFARLQVPEADVSIQRAGGGDGAIVTNVHWHHAQLMAFQGPLELQLLIWPAEGSQ